MTNQNEQEKKSHDSETDLKEETAETVTEASEVEELREKNEELTDQNLRLQAEIQNMHKRANRERELATKYRSQDLAKSILPVIDNLERALAIEVNDEAGQNLKDGVKMVLDTFEAALTAEGIEKQDCLGQPFDPNYQEAYTQVPAEEGQESGIVAEVFENGYTLHDRLIRAAKVAVTA